jgi:reactive chlorine resistance protein C
MRKRLISAENLQAVGASTLRLGLALNLVVIGRLKFEDYEVENIRPLVTSHPMFARLVSKFGEEKLARLIGVTEIVIGSLIAAKPLAPRVSAVGSWAAAGMFATTLSFLITTREAWHEMRPEPKLSPTGQFLVKDIVLLGASLLTAGESLRAGSPASRRKAGKGEL